MSGQYAAGVLIKDRTEKLRQLDIARHARDHGLLDQKQFDDLVAAIRKLMNELDFAIDKLLEPEEKVA